MEALHGVSNYRDSRNAKSEKKPGFNYKFMTGVRKTSLFFVRCRNFIQEFITKLTLYANKLQLFSLKEESKHNKSSKKGSKLQGLIEVLEHLLLPANDDDSSVKGYLKFDIANEILCAHQQGPVDETTFRDALLHPEYGLCTYIATLPILTGITTRFIVLKSPMFNSIEFLSEIEKLKVNLTEIVGNNQTKHWAPENSVYYQFNGYGMR